MRRPQGLKGTIAQFVHFLAEEKYYKKKAYAFYDLCLGTSKKPYADHADYDPCPRPTAWARVKKPYADYDLWRRPTVWAQVINEFPT